MHNKPNTLVLCSKTKSGKLIDKIIKHLNGKQFLKTNLYDVDYYPKEDEKYNLASDWILRIDPYSWDIIVLLGREVHDNFIMPPDKGNVIKIAHPSSIWSKENMDKYVNDTVDKITSLIIV